MASFLSHQAYQEQLIVNAASHSVRVLGIIPTLKGKGLLDGNRYSFAMYMQCMRTEISLVVGDRDGKHNDKSTNRHRVETSG